VALKILVVDDEADVPLLIRQRFRKQVQALEMEFRFAANGVEALAALESEGDIDIVLSDINMPEMDGLTLLGRLSGHGTTPKTVIVSAYGDMENIRAAMNLGAFDFVTKPIDFADLQATIDKTTRELTVIKEALATRDELVGLRRELQIAADIQRALLPHDVPGAGSDGRFDLHGDMIPAQEIGGDFFDCFMIDDHRLGFLVADVSGKGVGAALYMAVCRTLLRARGRKGLSPDICIARLNEELCHDADAGMFVTVFYAILDVETGQLDYSLGGHPPPFILGASGGARPLDQIGGTVVGMLGDATFQAGRVVLAPGEFLVAYSDGVTEAMDERDDLYSQERLEAFLKDLPRSSCVQVSKDVMAEVVRWAGTAPQADDTTVLTLGYRTPRP
jgi:sigma-B regulation protein RsbU (phosphoserine phosphatase)